MGSSNRVHTWSGQHKLKIVVRRLSL
jgi:hypothetical protein